MLYTYLHIHIYLHIHTHVHTFYLGIWMQKCRLRILRDACDL